MSVLALAAAAALRLLDPTGDAAGDGTLMPPTSPVYANAAVFDLQEVTLTPGAAEGEPAVLGVAMGAIERTDLMPAGFNRVVVDVYIDVVEGGAEATLAGPDLLMPPGRGWDYVVRLTPRGASGAAAPLDADVAVQWQPLPLAIDADVFVVTLPWPVTEDAQVYAVSGLYDAFSSDSWRALTPSPSPWSFSSATQTSPVLDVLAVDQQAQARALTDGVLPAPAVRRDSGLPWLLLALFGVLIAGFGLWLRRRVPAPAVVAAGVEDAVPAEAEAEDAALEEAEAAGAVLGEAEATGGAPAEAEAADGAPAEVTAEVTVEAAAPETAALEAETGVAAPEVPVSTAPVEPPEDGGETEAEGGTEPVAAAGDPGPGPSAAVGAVGADGDPEGRTVAASVEPDAGVGADPDASEEPRYEPSEEPRDQPSEDPRDEPLEPRDEDRDPIAAAWADDEDGEEEADDLAAFLSGGARRRELRVEHADEDDEPA